MKKLYALITIIILSLSVGVAALAQSKGSGKKAGKSGCSSCGTSCATPEQMRKFRAETIDLRQEMMNKRFDLQRENLKETPDSARVAAIKGEMDAIKAKIDAIKTAQKLPVSGSCCTDDCPLLDDCCGSGVGCKNCCSAGACDKCCNASCSDCCKNRKGKRK